jgi:hypothetical protein
VVVMWRDWNTSDSDSAILWTSLPLALPYTYTFYFRCVLVLQKLVADCAAQTNVAVIG